MINNKTKQENMSDLGYQHKTVMIEADQYTKVLEHTSEREVVEEVTVYGITIQRRLRIIEWDTEKPTKTSKSIRYEKLPVPDEYYYILTR